MKSWSGSGGAQSNRLTREEVNQAMAVLNTERVHLTKMMSEFRALNVSTSQEEEGEEKFEDAEELKRYR